MFVYLTLSGSIFLTFKEGRGGEARWPKGFQMGAIILRAETDLVGTMTFGREIGPKKILF